MNIRRSLFWFAATTLLLVALSLWFAKQKPKGDSPIDLAETNATLQMADASNQPTDVSIQANAPITSATQSLNAATSTLQNKIDRTIDILSTYNDQPIVFHGKVEDQFSNVVAGARVNFGVRIMNGYESTVKRGQVISDASGLFTISGYKGQDLGLGVEKPGYTWVAMNGSSIYSKLGPEDQRAHPDPNNPTIIKMWKLQGAEPLVKIDQNYKIPFTGAPIFLDLVAGKIVSSGGDLEVIITRSPGPITQRNHGDWSIELVPASGGIMESDYHTSQVTFEAPENGYQNKCLVQMSHDSPDWFDNIQKVFFLTSRGGQVYSKFSLDFGINRDPNGTMWFQFKGAGNTNGSRNWEATAPQ